MWKDISGYEGIYKVNQKGEIQNTKGKILKTFIINSGYECISLYKDKVKSNLLVHRLVAREFCKGYSPKLEIDHIDNNRLNNNSYNLRWVTRKENIKDCVDRGVNSISLARKHIDNRKKVAMIDPKSLKVTRIFDSIKEADEFVGISSGKISGVCNGKRNKAGGYYWKHL